MLVVVLSDSLLSAHHGYGTRMRQLSDAGESFDTCLCVASGGGIMYMPISALKMAVSALSERSDVLKHTAEDPPAYVMVIKGADSIAYCRESKKEFFPNFASDRKRSPLVSRMETPWSICDLEDVVKQAPDRKKFPELELCKLRHERGIYGKKDIYHLRDDIAKAAEDELLKAVRRTALERYGDKLNDNGVLFVVAAGWNTDKLKFSSLDRNGKAWRRAELIATAELCALSGHPISAFLEKGHELMRRCRGAQRGFLNQRIRSIRSLRPPQTKGLKRQIKSNHPQGAIKKMKRTYRDIGAKRW